MNSVVTHEGIQQRIFLLRGQKVMLDSDLAELRSNEIVRDFRTISCFNFEEKSMTT